MANPVEVTLLTGAITSTLAGAVGFGIYLLTRPQHEPASPPDLGRKWFAWAAIIISFATLPSFFRLFDGNSIATWVISLVFYGGIAFGAGWLYGKLVKFSTAGIGTSAVPKESSTEQSMATSRLTAARGDADAQYNLGVAYANGDGVTQNNREAAKWFRLAAEQGHAGAQFESGLIYASGENAAQDYSEAIKWYRLAAAQGEVKAQYYLGHAYANGNGVAQNPQEAAKWYRLAAAHGFEQAQAKDTTALTAAAGTTEKQPELLPMTDYGEDTKECPFCKETVKARAVVCKHCRRDI